MGKQPETADGADRNPPHRHTETGLEATGVRQDGGDCSLVRERVVDEAHEAVDDEEGRKPEERDQVDDRAATDHGAAAGDGTLVQELSGDVGTSPPAWPRPQMMKSLSTWMKLLTVALPVAAL